MKRVATPFLRVRHDQSDLSTRDPCSGLPRCRRRRAQSRRMRSRSSRRRASSRRYSTAPRRTVRAGRDCRCHSPASTDRDVGLVPVTRLECGRPPARAALFVPAAGGAWRGSRRRRRRRVRRPPHRRERHQPPRRRHVRRCRQPPPPPRPGRRQLLARSLLAARIEVIAYDSRCRLRSATTTRRPFRRRASSRAQQDAGLAVPGAAVVRCTAARPGNSCP